MTSSDPRQMVIDMLTATTRPKTMGSVEITDETPLGGAGLGVNSMAMLQTFVGIEQEYGIVFDDRAVAGADLCTVGDLVDFVRRTIASAS